MLEDERSPVSMGGMDQLFQLAEETHAHVGDENFSNEIAALTQRLAEMSKHNLQLDLENRELRSRIAPTQIELQACREESKFLKSQVQEFWSEIESISRQKTDIYRERCEVVRRMTDEVSAAKTELLAEKRRAELLEVEVDRFRKQALSTASELRAKHEGSDVETQALKERLAKQGAVISTLEKKCEFQEKLRETISGLEKNLSEKSMELLKAQHTVGDVQTELLTLREEKEALLQRLVSNKENRGASAVADTLLGHSNWTLSELVDALSHAKNDISAKRSELEKLKFYVEEMRNKESEMEGTKQALERAESELSELRSYNEEIKQTFEQRENLIDSLQYEKMKVDTELVSAKLRSADSGKQIAALVHENEALRNRLGLHAGPGRTNPVLGAVPFDSDKKRSRRDSSLNSPRGMLVTQFRTVHDLVEQNMELKEKVDRLKSSIETEAQDELARLKIQFSKIDRSNRELELSCGEKTLQFERTVTRLESEVKRYQAEADMLKKSIVGLDLTAQSESGIVAHVKEEFHRQLAVVNADLTEARALVARTVGELDRVREDLKREIEEKTVLMRNCEKLKSEHSQMSHENSGMKLRVNALEIERETLTAKLEEAKVQLSLLTKQKQEFEHRISNLKSVVDANERAYRELASEKESQSSTLVSYHSRLEKEAAMYQTNASALKKLYHEELSKNKDNLNFYQTAYEEQIRRCNELSGHVSALVGDKERLLAEIDTLRAKLVSVEPVQDPALLEELAQFKSYSESLQSQLGEYENLGQQLHDWTQKNSELEAEIESYCARIASLEAELESAEAKRSASLSDELSKLEEAESRIISLEEQLRRERLAVSGKESILRAQIEDLRNEKIVQEQQVHALMASTEYKGEGYSASARESQLVADLQRSRETLDMLLRENQALKPVVQERDDLLALRAHDKLKLQSLSELVTERDRLLEQVNQLSVQTHDSETLAQLEKAKSQLTQTVSKLREEAAKKVAEIAALSERTVKIETELKHVQEQLAVREKDVVRQDGLMKLKDKRITELENASAPQVVKSSLASDDQIKQLMELVNEYQAALAEATLSKKPAPISPTSTKRRAAFKEQLEPAAGDNPEEPVNEPAPAKRARQSVYHDAEEEEEESME
jgi:chromosome segregation ATPase